MVGIVVVLVLGVIAGAISGVIGTGSSLILLPVLSWSYGPQAAVPIMTIAAVMANLSRIMVWWRLVDWRAFLAYAITAAPAAALGARTLLSIAPGLADAAIGAFLLGMVPFRHWLARHELRITLGHLSLVGAVIGFVTGIVVSTGPLTVPAFMALGLVKGAFISTEAAGSLAVYVSKGLAFRQLGALPWEIVAQGLIAGGALMAGTFAGKRFVLRMTPQAFRLLLDGLLLMAGSVMLWNALAAWLGEG